MTEVHLVADERTTWRVDDGDAATLLSEHTNATAAEMAARVGAEDRDADRVVVHARYHRTHDAPPSPAVEAARERLKRTRLLDRVRERARQLARAAR